MFECLTNVCHRADTNVDSVPRKDKTERVQEQRRASGCKRFLNNVYSTPIYRASRPLIPMTPWHGAVISLSLVLAACLCVHGAFNLTIVPEFPVYNPAFTETAPPTFYVFGSRAIASGVTTIAVNTTNCAAGVSGATFVSAARYYNDVFRLLCTAMPSTGSVTLAIANSSVLSEPDATYGGVGATSGHWNLPVAFTLPRDETFNPYEPPYCGAGAGGRLGVAGTSTGLQCVSASPVPTPSPAPLVDNFQFEFTSRTVLSSRYGAYISTTAVHDGGDDVTLFITPLTMISGMPSGTQLSDLYVDTYNCANQSSWSRATPVGVPGQPPDRMQFVVTCLATNVAADANVTFIIRPGVWVFVAPGGATIHNELLNATFVVAAIAPRSLDVVTSQTVARVAAGRAFPYPLWQLGAAASSYTALVAIEPAPGTPTTFGPSTFALNPAISNSSHCAANDVLIAYLPDVTTGDLLLTDSGRAVPSNGSLWLLTSGCTSVSGVYRATEFVKAASMLAWFATCTINRCEPLTVAPSLPGGGTLSNATLTTAQATNATLMGFPQTTLTCVTQALPALPMVASSSPSPTPTPYRSMPPTPSVTSSFSASRAPSASPARSPSPSNTGSALSAGSTTASRSLPASVSVTPSMPPTPTPSPSTQRPVIIVVPATPTHDATTWVYFSITGPSTSNVSSLTVAHTTSTGCATVVTLVPGSTAGIGPIIACNATAVQTAVTLTIRAGVVATNDGSGNSNVATVGTAPFRPAVQLWTNVTGQGAASPRHAGVGIVAVTLDWRVGVPGSANSTTLTACMTAVEAAATTFVVGTVPRSLVTFSAPYNVTTDVLSASVISPGRLTFAVNVGARLGAALVITVATVSVTDPEEYSEPLPPATFVIQDSRTTSTASLTATATRTLSVSLSRTRSASSSVGLVTASRTRSVAASSSTSRTVPASATPTTTLSASVSASTSRSGSRSVSKSPSPSTSASFETLAVDETAASASSNTALIAGVAGGAGAAVLAGIALWWYCRRLGPSPRFSKVPQEEGVSSGRAFTSSTQVGPVAPL